MLLDFSPSRLLSTFWAPCAANDDLEQFLSHVSATGGQTCETLRVYAESQIAQKRTAQSQHQGKTGDKEDREDERQCHGFGQFGQRQQDR